MMSNLSLQGDSDRLNPKYQIGYIFFCELEDFFKQFSSFLLNGMEGHPNSEKKGSGAKPRWVVMGRIRIISRMQVFYVMLCVSS